MAEQKTIDNTVMRVELIGDFGILFIQDIEKRIDSAIKGTGITRSESTKSPGEGAIFKYWQFARCGEALQGKL